MKVSQLAGFWKSVRGGLFEIIDKYSEEDLDFKAFPGGYSVREIILHIAQEEYGEIHYGITRKISEFPPPYDSNDYLTVQSLKELLSSVHAETLLYLEGVGDPEMEREIEAGWGGKYLLSDLLWHVLEHEIHHRGELSLILGLLGREGLDA